MYEFDLILWVLNMDYEQTVEKSICQVHMDRKLSEQS